nr:MAG TPA: hypothetical protein [Caudoviricetes sp.]
MASGSTAQTSAAKNPAAQGKLQSAIFRFTHSTKTVK